MPAERPAPTPTPRGSGGPATATRTATPVGAATPTPLSTTVPPDPSLVAPPVARGVVSIPALGTSFLYTGADPVQTGVAAGTIDARRAAVLRGRVLTTAGAPIAGVTIDIQGHPELGTTRTQLDGGFDLVANGGGPLTVRYRKDGLLAVTRELDVPWQQFVMVPDVVMMALDAAVTAVTFGPNAPFQTAASTTQNDGDGTRHTLLLFPAGTSARLVLADGSTQSAGTLHVRATEFTVGASGPAAMPAALPPLSGYTYCTELSADEAIAAGATTVAFDQPVIAYTENFLDFPVGAAVPLGFFDRRRAVWVAEPNGRIVKITRRERRRRRRRHRRRRRRGRRARADDSRNAQSLGAAYPAGTSLWRMPTEHFSPHDGNNPFDTTGDTPPGENGAGPDADDTTQDSCQSGGSIIECENQVLGEKVAIVGTPYTLDYRSDRVPARSASKHIRLSGAAVPPTLASIDLHLAVAGRSFDQSFPASPNQETTFTWDRMDAYGRQLIGGQTLAVTIDYNYPAVYREPGPFPEAFNQTGGTTFGANPTRQQVNLSDHFTTTIGEGLTDARTIGLGGWSLGVHHVYDPVARVLHTGGGSRQRAGSLARLLATIDLPGKSVLFDVATGPDGSLYVALPHHDEIMRIAPDGTETVVAGTGTEGFSGDGGPATAAELGDPTGVAVAADGSLYIAEQGNRRVRRVGVDGIITTIAGTDAIGTSGDGGPATQASFTTAERIAVGSDASIYVVDGGTRIRRITTDGIIRTVAGNGVVGFGGDGGPATSAKLNCASVSAAADGGFYIADIFNHRVRRVAPDGTIATIVDYTADQGTPASVRPAPDGGSADRRLLHERPHAGGRSPQDRRHAPHDRGRRPDPGQGRRPRDASQSRGDPRRRPRTGRQRVSRARRQRQSRRTRERGPSRLRGAADPDREPRRSRALRLRSRRPPSPDAPCPDRRRAPRVRLRRGRTPRDHHREDRRHRRRHHHRARRLRQPDRDRRPVRPAHRADRRRERLPRQHHQPGRRDAAAHLERGRPPPDAHERARQDQHLHLRRRRPPPGRRRSGDRRADAGAYRRRRRSSRSRGRPRSDGSRAIPSRRSPATSSSAR